MSAVPLGDTRPLRRWLRGEDRPDLVVCCVEHPDAAGWSRTRTGSGSRVVVQLATCLAALPPAVLLELVAGGASGITVALDGCDGPAEAADLVASTRAFLSALGRPETIESLTAVPADLKHGSAWPILVEGAVPVSRRALFGRPDGLDLAEPSEHPTQRLVAVLRELAGGDGSLAATTGLDGIPTGIPRLTASGCAGSGQCARTCPVDALTLTRTVLAEATPDREAMAQFQLTFTPGLCTDCGQCLEVCPEPALQRSGEYLWSSLLAGEPVSLRVGLIRSCSRCGGPHGRLGELCAVCAFRAANPFGSTMPPGWVARRPTGPR